MVSLSQMVSMQCDKKALLYSPGAYQARLRKLKVTVVRLSCMFRLVCFKICLPTNNVISHLFQAASHTFFCVLVFFVPLAIH